MEQEEKQRQCASRRYRNDMARHRIPSHRIASHRIALHRTAPHRTSYCVPLSPVL